MSKQEIRKRVLKAIMTKFNSAHDGKGRFASGGGSGGGGGGGGGRSEAQRATSLAAVQDNDHNRPVNQQRHAAKFGEKKAKSIGRRLLEMNHGIWLQKPGTSQSNPAAGRAKEQAAYAKLPKEVQQELQSKGYVPHE